MGYYALRSGPNGPDNVFAPTWVPLTEKFGYASSGLVLFASFCILLTGTLFWSRMVRKKIYMKIIMCTAFCDFMTAFPMVAGYQYVNNEWCAVQGIMLLGFLRCSVMFTSFMIFTLHQQIYKGRIPLKFTTGLIVIVVINVLLAVAPFFAGFTYGGCEADRFGGYGSILLNSKEPEWTNPKLYSDLQSTFENVFIWPVFSNICLQAALLLHLELWVIPKVVNDGGEGAQADKEKLRRMISNVIWYPFSALAAWLPFFMYQFICSSNSTEEKCGPYWIPLNLGTYVWASTYGFMIGVTFFYKSTEARTLWRKLLRKLFELLCVKQPPESHNNTQEAPETNSHQENYRQSYVLNLIHADETDPHDFLHDYDGEEEEGIDKAVNLDMDAAWNVPAAAETTTSPQISIALRENSAKSSVVSEVELTEL